MMVGVFFTAAARRFLIVDVCMIMRWGPHGSVALLSHRVLSFQQIGWRFHGGGK